MAKKNYIISPRGSAVYPHLNKPDTKYKKDFGEYHTKLSMTLDEGKDLQARIDTAMKEELATEKKRLTTAVAEAANDKAKKEATKKLKALKMSDKPYSIDEDEGTITFSFKMAAGGISRKDNERFTQRPAMFDAAGTPCPDAKVGGGSILKVAFEIHPFSTAIGSGVSLRMRAVQIIKLVEWGSGNAESFGFSEEDGEFAAAAAGDEATDTETTEDAETTTEDDEF